jgi:hypothetical protein
VIPSLRRAFAREHTVALSAATPRPFASSFLLAMTRACGVSAPIAHAHPTRSFAPAPEPDARNCRCRVSGILASMSSIESKRISGTYWERLLLIAMPIPLVMFGALLFKDPSNISWEICLIIVLVILLVWVVDSEPLRRYHTVPLFDGVVLALNDEALPPSSILSITPLTRYRPRSTQLLEVTFRTHDGNRTVHILSKPELVPFGLFTSEPKTLRLLLKSHPELRKRVQPERII